MHARAEAKQTIVNPNQPLEPIKFCWTTQDKKPHELIVRYTVAKESVSFLNDRSFAEIYHLYKGQTLSGNDVLDIYKHFDDNFLKIKKTFICDAAQLTEDLNLLAKLLHEDMDLPDYCNKLKPSDNDYWLKSRIYQLLWGSFCWIKERPSDHKEDLPATKRSSL